MTYHLTTDLDSPGHSGVRLPYAAYSAGDAAGHRPLDSTMTAPIITYIQDHLAGARFEVSLLKDLSEQTSQVAAFSAKVASRSRVGQSGPGEVRDANRRRHEHIEGGGRLDLAEGGSP